MKTLVIDRDSTAFATLTDDERELFDCGTTVFETHSIRRSLLDTWVGEIVALSGQRVAWFSSGGRIVIKALGNIDRVRVAIKLLRNMHNSLFAACCSSAGPDEIAAMLSAIWLDNKVL